jgi:hypothetical protein
VFDGVDPAGIGTQPDALEPVINGEQIPFDQARVDGVLLGKEIHYG